MDVSSLLQICFRRNFVWALSNALILIPAIFIVTTLMELWWNFVELFFLQYVTIIRYIQRRTFRSQPTYNNINLVNPALKLPKAILSIFCFWDFLFLFSPAWLVRETWHADHNYSMWVASRNWRTWMTCLLKKLYLPWTFHYFSAANQNFVKILVATCSSHHCRPKMSMNLYSLGSWKYIFLTMKLHSGDRHSISLVKFNE